jgi:hypothetical protein
MFRFRDLFSRYQARQKKAPQIEMRTSLPLTSLCADFDAFEISSPRNEKLINDLRHTVDRLSEELLGRRGLNRSFNEAVRKAAYGKLSSWLDAIADTKETPKGDYDPLSLNVILPFGSDSMNGPTWKLDYRALVQHAISYHKYMSIKNVVDPEHAIGLVKMKDALHSLAGEIEDAMKADGAP